jgi:hypothetical protein
MFSKGPNGMLDVILISICVSSFQRLHMLQAYAVDLEWSSLFSSIRARSGNFEVRVNILA